MPSKRQPIPFTGQSHKGKNIFTNSEECINYYPETMPDGKVVLRGSPGLVEFADTGIESGVRGMIVVAGLMYVVVGSTLFSITILGTVTTIGNISISTPMVSMVENSLQVGMFGGPKGYVYTIADDSLAQIKGNTTGSLVTLTDVTAGVCSTESTEGLAVGDLWKFVSGEFNGQVYEITALTDDTSFTLIDVSLTDSGSPGTGYKATATGFPGADTATYQDGFAIVNRPGTAQFFKSALNDFTSWDALDFSSAGWKSDNLVAVFSDHRDLLLMGEISVEPWYNTGAATFPFSRRPGAEMEIGLAAPASIASGDNGVFWLSRNDTGQGLVMQALGLQARIVSTTPINEAIRSYSDISDAIGFTYQQDGHIFYEITFPTGNATWVYDSTTQMWHERQSITDNMRLGRHRVQHHVFFANKNLVGDYANGKIWELTRDAYSEGDTDMPAIRTSQTLVNNQDLLTFDELQILFTPGVGLAKPQTAPAGDESILNGEFETNPNVEWTAINSATLASVTNGKSGKCLRILANGSDNPGATQDITVLAGIYYDIIGYVWSGEPSSEFTYRAYVLDVDNSVIIADTGELEEENKDWSTEIQLGFEVPYGCSTIRLYLIVGATAGDASALWFDSFTIERLYISTEYDPKVIISWSDDGGYTWSNEIEVSIGKVGEYKNRAMLWRLGQGRNRVFRSKITARVIRDILGAFAMVEVDQA